MAIQPPLERDISTHDYTGEAMACQASGRIPINPYACPDGEGLTTALGLRDLLDCSLDPGTAGGALFLLGISSQTPLKDIIEILKLRDETYQRYHAIRSGKSS